MTTTIDPKQDPLFLHLPLEKIRISTSNPRHHQDKASFQELVKSVGEHGVINPVLVRVMGDDYELVAGERRYKAAKEVGLSTIPAIVRRLTVLEAIEIQVIENLQRSDVHPLDEADGYRALMDQLRYGVKDLAAKVGKSTSYIVKRLALSSLVKIARDRFFADEITVSHAIELARLTPKEQEKVLKVMFEKVYQGGYDARQSPEVAWPLEKLQRHIREHVHLDLADAAFPKGDSTLPGGACTSCPKRTGFNSELFNDIAAKDRCTDPACFSIKSSRFLAMSRERVEYKNGKPPVEISGSAWGTGKLPARNKWEVAKAGDKDAVAAIIVDGKGKGRSLFVKKASVFSSRPGDTADARAKREAQEARFKRERLVGEHLGELLWPLLAKAAPTSLGKREDIDLIANAADCRWPSETVTKALGLRHGVRLESLTTGTLVKLILLSMMDAQMNLNEVVKVAARWGVDVKALRARVEAEMAGAEKKAAADRVKHGPPAKHVTAPPIPDRSKPGQRGRA